MQHYKRGLCSCMRVTFLEVIILRTHNAGKLEVYVTLKFDKTFPARPLYA
jgi:hypothetical protein